MKRHNRRAPVYEYLPLRINTAAASATPVGKQVNTTSTTAVAAPGSVVITPASMANITVVGMVLQIFGGTGTAEEVVVTALSSTTFTATFANTHSGTYNICSVKGTFLHGVTTGVVGTTSTLTLYNGNPNATPAGVQFATVDTTTKGTVFYDVVLDQGLWYTASATPGDNTVTYLDEY